LVRSRLNGHPALSDLEKEIAGAAATESEKPSVDDPGEALQILDDLTRRQLELSFKAVITRDSQFAADLAKMLSKLRPSAAEPAAQNANMQARALGNARIYQAGRDQHISGT
jgi:hypothetical protein